MKKKRQIFAYKMLISLSATLLFFNALITEHYFNTLIGFILLIGGWVITYLGKNEVKSESNKKTVKDDSNEPKVIFDFELAWKRFLNWLNN